MASVSMLGRLTADTAALRLRLETLTRQSATGQKTDRIGDLSPQLPRALTVSAELRRRDVYGTAIGNALDRTSVMQTTLQRLSVIARQFADNVAVKLDPNNTSTLASVATQAKAAMVEIGQLLNTQSNGEYVFGGSDFGNPPIPDPDGLPTSSFATNIATAVSNLVGVGASTVAIQTLGIAETDDSPFSSFLSTTGLTEPLRSVPAGDGQVIPYGVLANHVDANRKAADPANTTGSWARDLLRGLASLAGLTPAQAASPTDFRALADTIRTGLKSAENALADEQGALGQTETRLQAAKERHSILTDALKSQLSDIEEVDLAATLTRMQATQTALQASYSAISRLGSLTLTSYLS